MKGILLIDKPSGKTSFDLVQAARRVFTERCIGHAGTLDPLATGLLVLLIGRDFTKLSNLFLCQDKVYQTTVLLGAATTTYDKEGAVTEESSLVPTLEDLQLVISTFQGTILQVPPMFSAKKVGGKKLCDLARKGITIERTPCKVTVLITLLKYAYPILDLEISCTKGTYIRSLGHDIGKKLGCFGHLKALRRIKSGSHHVNEALDGNLLLNPDFSENDLKRSSFYDMIPTNL